MTASTSVKWAVSSMTGAPTLNGTAGSLIAVLDAFLVNGFGTKAVDSAVVTGGICRMVITGGSAAQDHCVIQLAGVTGSGVTLNGLQRVKAATGSYVEFACDLPDGPLTGAITFKIAPLGWEKVFSKTNVAVYRSTDPASAKPYLRIDDTNALYARVQMYEVMSDVDTGIGVAQPVSGGGYWHKRSAASAAAVYWVLAGDSRAVVLMVAPNTSSSAMSSNGFGVYGHAFGEIFSYRSGDAWAGILCAAPSSNYTDLVGCAWTANGTTGMVVQRASAGVGGSAAVRRFVAGSTAAASGADASLGAFPSRADNGLRLSPVVISDGDMAANGPRGVLPGVYHCPQTLVLAYYGADYKLTDGQGDLSGRKLLSVGCGNLAGAASGVGFIDVTGPWR